MIKPLSRNAILGIALLSTGCHFLDGDRQDPAAKFRSHLSQKSENTTFSTINPPTSHPTAKVIRFDGNETVLGDGSQERPSTEQFDARLDALLANQKRWTAANWVRQNRVVGQQALWGRLGRSADQGGIEFIAEVLSEEIPGDSSWSTLLKAFENRIAEKHAYLQARERLSHQPPGLTAPTSIEAEQILGQAKEFQHPLVVVDALSLVAFRQAETGQQLTALTTFQEAAAIAEQSQDFAQAAQCWMMALKMANLSNQQQEAKDAWRKAVESELNRVISNSVPLRSDFWSRAAQGKPADLLWPTHCASALIRYCKPVGCDFSPQSPVELVVWCAIAQDQYEQKHPELALVSFKKAERLTQNDDHAMWLQIAQSKCLAGLGQAPAAAALLSGPAANENPIIAAAANAAIGSSKLRTGAYRQGLLLLDRALNESSGSFMATWWSRPQAQADLALAQLIVGDITEGLESLHAAQSGFQSQSDSASLLQSLDNELAILEHEGQDLAAAQVRQRIALLEGRIR